MAGRRRRRRAASTSTAATVDESAIRYHKEHTVLKHLAVAPDSNDWPLVTLNDATVVDKHGRMANQLEVELVGPFTIRGRLQPGPEIQKLRMSLRPNCRNPVSRETQSSTPKLRPTFGSKSRSPPRIPLQNLMEYP